MPKTTAFVLVLCLCVAHVRADDNDPEPPSNGAGLLRQLKGKWTGVRSVTRGEERKGLTLIYGFDGDKLTLDNGRTKTVFTVKVDAKQKPAVIEWAVQGQRTTRLFIKVEKGELYVAGDFGDSKAAKDFSGKTGSMVVFEREKK